MSASNVQRCAGCNKPLSGPPYEKDLFPDGYVHDEKCYTLALENENKLLRAAMNQLQKETHAAIGVAEGFQEQIRLLTNLFKLSVAETKKAQEMVELLLKRRISMGL